MEMKAILRLLALLLMMGCFAVAMAIAVPDNASKSQDPVVSEEEASGKNVEKTENREKRSREEIMFGNQQNKPSGLVDDLMEMPNKVEGEVNQATATDEGTKNSTDSDQLQQEVILKEEKDEDKRNLQNQYENVDNDSVDNWYAGPQVSEEAIHYILNSPGQALPVENDDDGSSIYDQEIYRRKRQLLGHPLSLRKRSLRSPLGQMVSRGRRLPRRSMRLKRQVDVGDLLSLLGNLDNNGRFLDEQVPTSYKLRIHELPHPEFRYPYGLVRSDNEGDEDEDEQGEIPGARYLESETSLPYNERNEVESMKVPEWMIRHPPSVFSVARRSAPAFYPLDYRFIPSPYNKKRTPRGRLMMNAAGEDEEEETDFGKWGRIVQVPETYASAEDVARLYALANLMAETDDAQPRIRRSL